MSCLASKAEEQPEGEGALQTELALLRNVLMRETFVLGGGSAPESGMCYPMHTCSARHRTVPVLPHSAAEHLYLTLLLPTTPLQAPRHSAVHKSVHLPHIQRHTAYTAPQSAICQPVAVPAVS